MTTVIFESIFISVTTKLKLNRADLLVFFIYSKLLEFLNKSIRDRENRGFILRNTMQIDKLHTFVNEWNLDEISFMVDLRIDKKTKEMLNLTPSQNSCFK